MHAKQVQKKITAYNLMDRLVAVLEVAIDGGTPAQSTIYSAFRRGETGSEREKTIVDIARRLVEAHEEMVEQAVEHAIMTAQTATL
jgi:hypothetical protein